MIPPKQVASSYLCVLKVVKWAMAKGKYHDWITPDGLLKVQAWARNGLTDEQIAHNIGISKETFYQWKKTFPDFSDALKKGKEVVDIQVENALLKRALGYTFTEVTRERVIEPDPSTGQPVEKLVVTKEVVKEVQPDTTAQIFWLKNRKPQDWRDRKEVGVDGSIETKGNNPFAGLTTEELKKLIQNG